MSQQDQPLLILSSQKTRAFKIREGNQRQASSGFLFCSDVQLGISTGLTKCSVQTDSYLQSGNHASTPLCPSSVVGAGGGEMLKWAHLRPTPIYLGCNSLGSAFQNVRVQIWLQHAHYLVTENDEEHLL